MKIFHEYVQKGMLKEQRSNFRQIKKQFARAHKDLSTFELLYDTDPEWACTIVYQPMLRAGRALLFAKGFLPADGRQHKTVVELTGKILGGKYKLLIEQFERLRRKRNVFFYDSEESVSSTEARRAVGTARDLPEVIERTIQEDNPQMQLEY